LAVQVVAARYAGIFKGGIAPEVRPASGSTRCGREGESRYQRHMRNAAPGNALSRCVRTDSQDHHEDFGVDDAKGPFPPRTWRRDGYSGSTVTSCPALKLF